MSEIGTPDKPARVRVGAVIFWVIWFGMIGLAAFGGCEVPHC